MKFPLRQVNGWALLAGVLWFSTACVTVNIYFPAAAAEQAAEGFVKDVLGDQTPAGAPKPQSRLYRERRLALQEDLLNILVPAAQAQDFNIDTPTINRLKRAMAERNEQLKPYYQSGAVGFARDGLLAIRDLNAVPLNERNTVKRLVQQENIDRNALYREIAAANGHPEWEPKIRETFARQWIENAHPGWWVEGPGGWRQK